jgi:hypothetical protein
MSRLGTGYPSFPQGKCLEISEKNISIRVLSLFIMKSCQHTSPRVNPRWSAAGTELSNGINTVVGCVL